MKPLIQNMTPTPWESRQIISGRPQGNEWQVVGKGGRIVADCYTEEDARLISSAPELLDMLEHLKLFVAHCAFKERNYSDDSRMAKTALDSAAILIKHVRGI